MEKKLEHRVYEMSYFLWLYKLVSNGHLIYIYLSTTLLFIYIFICLLTD